MTSCLLLYILFLLFFPLILFYLTFKSSHILHTIKLCSTNQENGSIQTCLPLPYIGESIYLCDKGSYNL